MNQLDTVEQTRSEKTINNRIKYLKDLSSSSLFFMSGSRAIVSIIFTVNQLQLNVT